MADGYQCLRGTYCLHLQDAKLPPLYITFEQSDYYDASIYEVLHFIQSVRLIKGQLKGEAQQIIEGCGARAGFYGPPLIHTYITFMVSHDAETTYQQDVKVSSGQYRKSSALNLILLQ
jgi:hypothetical protein